MGRKRRNKRNGNKKNQHEQSSATLNEGSNTEESAPSTIKRLTISSIIWALGIAAAIIGGIMVAFFGWLSPEIFDNAHAKDAVREAVRQDTKDIRHNIDYLDDGYFLALPQGTELSFAQKSFLDRWTYSDVDAGETIGKLVGELRQIGAATLSELHLKIDLEGRRNQQIYIDNIYPVNIHRASPYTGTLLFVTPQGGADNMKMILNFDEISPQARIAEKDGGGPTKPGDLFFRHKKISVKDGKEVTLYIKSTATRQSAAFEIRINYRIGGVARHIIINDNGRPFRLTPTNCTKQSKPKGDHEFTDGVASYGKVWRWVGGKIPATIEPVKRPARFGIPHPFCPQKR